MDLMARIDYLTEENSRLKDMLLMELHRRANPPMTIAHVDYKERYDKLATQIDLEKRLKRLFGRLWWEVRE